MFPDTQSYSELPLHGGGDGGGDGGGGANFATEDTPSSRMQYIKYIPIATVQNGSMLSEFFSERNSNCSDKFWTSENKIFGSIIDLFYMLW